MSNGTLASSQFLGMLESFEQLGYDAGPVLASCGLSRLRLLNPFARFAVEVEHTLWAAIERVAQDPAIGLRIGLESARSGRRTLDMYIALNSSTARETLANVERFVRLADDRGHVEVNEEDELAAVRVYRDGGYPRALGYLDALMAGSTTMMKERLEGFRLRQVHMIRPPPRDKAPYLQAFGVMPLFGSNTAEIRFDRALLDQRVKGADTMLVEILKEHATELLGKIPSIDPLLYSVQRALADGLEHGQVGLHSIARSTGTSARTLRRRLSDLGTSFQGELDTLRRDLAVQRLRAGRDPIASIADRLGFASTNAFQRAFRRWTGVAPSEYRQRERRSTD